MPFDSRLSNPEDYIADGTQGFRKQTKINYNDSFAAKSTQPPFNINRLESSDLRNRLMSKKPILNPRLNFVAGDPQEFQLFTGFDRFDTNRTELYDDVEGRARTRQNFTMLPEFNPIWAEEYIYSPTLNPDARVENPMPRLKRPDPKGFLAAAYAEGEEKILEKEG